MLRTLRMIDSQTPLQISPESCVQIETESIRTPCRRSADPSTPRAHRTTAQTSLRSHQDEVTLPSMCSYQSSVIEIALQTQMEIPTLVLTEQIDSSILHSRCCFLLLFEMQPQQKYSRYHNRCLSLIQCLLLGVLSSFRLSTIAMVSTLWCC